MKRLALMLVLGLVAVPAGAGAQPSEPGSRYGRVDRQGIRWLYSERIDPMTDRQQLALSATAGRFAVALLCEQGAGMRLTLVSPGPFFVPGVDQPMLVRIDQDAAFEVTFRGNRSDGRRGMARADEAGQALVAGLLAVRQRILIRNQDGDTLTILMSGSNQETARFRDRCSRIAS